MGKGLREPGEVNSGQIKKYELCFISNRELLKGQNEGMI